jgi:hypothetical protein
MLYVKPFLYLVTEAGVAKCLKAATGETVWRNRLSGRYSASPIWAEGRIYFVCENGTTTVIEAGPEFKVVARKEIREKCGASPAVSQQHIFIRSVALLYWPQPIDRRGPGRKASKGQLRFGFQAFAGTWWAGVSVACVFAKLPIETSYSLRLKDHSGLG